MQINGCVSVVSVDVILDHRLIRTMCNEFRRVPSEEFELTANSLGTHIETHGKLILRMGWDGIFGYLTSHEAYCLCVGNRSGHNLHTRG